jgi:hydroxypyruvate isomerase
MYGTTTQRTRSQSTGNRSLGAAAAEKISRRRLIGAAALAPLAISQRVAGSPGASGELSLPRRYTLTVNTELMFAPEMPRAKRIEQIAAQGMKAFSFWSVDEQEEKAMLAAQKRTGLACGSIAGSGSVGWTTGLTHSDHHQVYLDTITRNCEVAKRFGAPNVIIFVGKMREDIPWEKQYREIIAGLRKAGEIAQKYGVYLCLEPLNPVETPQISVLSARVGFKIIAEVDHPHVKLDFDMYHLQLGEGNLINNLKLGLEKGWIQFVEIGDVPGRKEPGTGEINYANIFRTLREAGYSGFVGLEHGTSTTSQKAMEVVRQLADAN